MSGATMSRSRRCQMMLDLVKNIQQNKRNDLVTTDVVEGKI